MMKNVTKETRAAASIMISSLLQNGFQRIPFLWARYKLKPAVKIKQNATIRANMRRLPAAGTVGEI